MKKVILILVLIGGAAAGGWYWWTKRMTKEQSTFRVVEVTRGDVISTITATGTVEPEEVVDVGAQVAGMIVAFGKDVNGNQIDYGSEVEEGTVLATIDDSLYASDVAQNKAQVDSAQANVERTLADLEQMKAKLDQADRDWQRAQRLGPSELLAQNAYDAFKAAYAGASATVKVGEASILQARAGLAIAQAGLQRSQRNLGFCIIKSPVKGIIIDRRVNAGQTVVSSLNAPSLFLIAKDLRRIQVWASVNEADISSIRPNQEASFSVDAFPGRTFRAKVAKVRLNAAMTQNVVTYTVVLAGDNNDGALLPYLTANVSFQVDKRSGVLRVPNAALRWMPTAAQIDPTEPASRGTAPATGSRPRREASSGAAQSNPPTPAPNTGTLWVQAEAGVRPIRVSTGMTDGTFTEVSGPDVVEGMSVIIGEERKQVGGAAGTTNPFSPQFNRGRSGGR